MKKPRLNIIGDIDKNSQAVVNVSDKAQEITNFINNSLNTLDIMEDKIKRDLSLIARVTEKFFSAIDQLAIKWIDWRSLSWQEKLRLLE